MGAGCVMLNVLEPGPQGTPANIFVQEVLAQSYTKDRVAWNWRSPSANLLCLTSSHRSYASKGSNRLRSEAALESIKRTNEQLDYCFVNARMKWIFGVYPHVFLTFSWGNIGSTSFFDGLNDRSRLCYHIPGARSNGLGGARQSNRAPKRRANVICIIYISGKHALWRSSDDHSKIVMQLRCD